MIPEENIYLVGGAVRDLFLDRPVNDWDYVVVGATPEDMKAAGYQQVGADFPVFLHPETGEEYALARTERKTGNGYGGFEVDASPSVTLEEDLARRDLTVNAMAVDYAGHMIDPFGGQRDIEDRVLRHTSAAFMEDPLRVLRVARFMARMANDGWRVDPATMEMMTAISRSGELEHLTPERIWKEMSRALVEPKPSAFIETLRECEALGKILPEVEALFGVPQPPKHHPEVDSGIHTLMVMEQAAMLSDRLEVRFGAMVHDLGKAVTPSENWPKHHGHEELGIPVIEALCDRLKVPNAIRTAGVQASEFHLNVHRALELKATTVVKMFDKLGIKNRRHQLDDLLKVSEADARGRTGLEHRDYPQAEYLSRLADSMLAVDAGAIAKGVEGGGQAIGEAVYRASVSAVKHEMQAGRGSEPGMS